MTSKVTAITPDAQPLRDALRASAPLARLGQLIADSKARFEVVRPLLPLGLVNHLQPGPLDDDGWSLLAANGAVAAKLRQLQPRLESALLDAGWGARPIRIKVVAR